MPDPRHPLIASQSRTVWGLEIGRFRLAVTRTRETRGFDQTPSPSRRPAWPIAIGAFASVSALGLLVVGATAAPRATEPGRYMVSLAVPAPARLASAAKLAPIGGRVLHRHVRSATQLSDTTFDPADEPHVAQAMATGAVQEWEDAAGQRRFLTAGPARTDGGRTCRDMALLVRLAEGGSHVRSAERCAVGVVPDTSPAEVPGSAD